MNPPSTARGREYNTSLRSLLRSVRQLFVAASMSLTILILLINFTPVVAWYARRLAGAWVDPGGDILIVLASEDEPGEIIGLESYWRCIYAIRAWREGHFRTIVISGGHTGNGQESLSAIMGQFMANYGVPSERIMLEQRSENTHENALFTARMVAGWPGRKVLLTSDYHMFRARCAFEAAGITVAPRPVPDILKRSVNITERTSCFCALCRETLKIAYYWYQGWTLLAQTPES